MPSLIRPTSKRRDETETRTSGVWHIRYYCPIRRRSHEISTGCRVRRNAERVLRQFCDLLERGEVHLENPFLARRRQRVEQADRLAISDCLAAFEGDLRAGRLRRGNRKPVGTGHAELTMARVRRVVEGCRLARADELDADAVNALLDRLQRDGEIRSNQTRKHYERAVKSFSRWLVSTERLDRDPLARVEVTHVAATDVVHDRGAFRPEEVEAVVAAARAAPVRSGLTGDQRALLYAFAACTGLRAKECAAVRKRDLAADLSSVRVAGLFTKNGREAVQPVPSFLRPEIAARVAGLGDDEFLWPGGWRRDAAGRWEEAGWVAGKEAGEFLRRDATTVGIVIGRKGRDANGGRVLDFHSFRHSYVSSLGRAGISEGLSRKLARASCRAILDRYTHQEFDELAAAVESIPSIRLGAGPPPASPPVGHPPTQPADPDGFSAGTASGAGPRAE
jgi:integrase